MTANTPGLVEALGQSDAFLAFMERVAAVARVDRPVVLVGERGSGKELAAARLHFHSPRWEGPFVVVNPAALPRTLLESELFGHEAGAFTGAARRRLGRFEMADRGTLFLDELQAAPRAVQEKLLRAVEYGAIERIGAGEPVNVDARVVAATNVDPRELVRRGRLMPDLLDRLAFAVLFVPSLRDRHGDIAYLAERFAARFAAELGRPEPPRFTAAALAALAAHDWPGNIRELKNTVERAVFEAPDTRIDHVVIDPFDQGRLCLPWTPPPGGQGPPGPLERNSPERKGFPDGVVQEGPRPSWPPEASLPAWNEAVSNFETDLLRQALARAGGNQRRAAEALGLTYHQFRGLYRKYAQALDAGRKAP